MGETPPTVVHDESASAELVPSDKKKRLSQRLAVCLDGSWNKRGSGTNIYHISNLIQEGTVTDKDGTKEWLQRVYYDEGVGTGVLDAISGGAFGVGVSDNVRQAYDWLVENYNDRDELYVFGFSRGAFTARSLVGLIAKCGLVYRGAPIPQEQLWEGYRKLGSKPEWRNDNSADNWAQRVENGDVRFRPLKFFKNDDGTRVDPEGEWPNHTEELLFKWSRRIEIKCLGVFDSVGTFGVEAVAIPWLQERRAQFHDTELSSRVVNAFQALGIDEHRANFSHIPFRRALKDKSAANNGLDDRIKQRWFVGAHSNIGGGYFDDTLAQFPLKWMMKECGDLGLQFVPVEPDQPGKPKHPKLKPAAQACIPLNPGPKVAQGKSIPGNVGDSFSEFMVGIWRYALRNKRNYRWIAPPPEYQNGQLVQSHETVDSSVEEIIRADKDAKAKRSERAYQPPNLWAYWQKSPNPEDRKRLLVAEPKHDDLDSRAARWWTVGWLFGKRRLVTEPEHVYLGNGTARWSTAGWLFGIAWAGLLIGYLSRGGWRLNWWWVLGILAATGVAFAADYFESLENHLLALDPRGDSAERRRSFYLDKLLNIRLFFLGASLVGVVFFLVSLAKWLSFSVPAWEVLWLFGLALIAVRLRASWDWSALPIAEMGNRSGGWLYNEGYAKRFKISAARKNDKQVPEVPETPEVLEVRRSWKKRALLRDLVGFIPASFIAIGFGWWLTLSLIARVRGAASEESDVIRGGLNMDYWLRAAAIAIAVIYALCAIFENRRQIGAAANSSKSSFLPARLVYWVGIAGFVLAILGLAGLQVCRLACKVAGWLAQFGWASCSGKCEFANPRLIPGDRVLPEWLAVVGAALAIYCLWSAIKQKSAKTA